MGTAPLERNGVRRICRALIWSCCVGLAGSALAEDKRQDPATVIVVVGAPGEANYEKDFQKWAENWEKAASRAGAREVTIGLKESAEGSDRELLKKTLANESTNGMNELWVVLIGHGTFDGKEAKFNLRGPDFSAEELASWVKPIHRPMAIINCASASGSFLGKLSAPDRIVVTAAKSGNEQNFARFGQYLSEAMTDLRADLDKDGQVSLLEAFLYASREVAEFYNLEGRLATEHALLDDNGDGLGTPADWFRGVRAVKKASEKALLDGVRANQFHLVRSEDEGKLSPEIRGRRDELERSIAKLREEKSSLGEDAYYQKLEALLVEMARLAVPKK